MPESFVGAADLNGRAQLSKQQLLSLEKLVQCDTQDPGLSCLILQKGQVEFEKHVGKDGFASAKSVAADSLFNIGSLTKPFTAVAILMLVEQNRLNLSDVVCHLLPVAKNLDPRITVSHLLSHTSGISEHTHSERFWNERELEKSPEQMASLFIHEPLMFEPGAAHDYCNSNYILLGMVIEAISGMAYGAFLKSSMFDPCDMHSTGFGGALASQATGYSWDENGLSPPPYPHISQAYAAGGLTSNARDLSRWFSALVNHKLINETSLALAWTPFKLNDGKACPYALGWLIDRVKGHLLVHHAGCIPGFSSFAGFYPQHEITVIMLRCCDFVPCDTMGIKAGQIAIGHPIADLPQIALADSVIEEYCGEYQLADGQTRTLRMVDGRFGITQDGMLVHPLFASDTDIFALQDGMAEVVFSRDSPDIPHPF